MEQTIRNSKGRFVKGCQIKLGSHFSQETKEIMREKKLGRTLTEEHKRNIGKSMIGRKILWADKIAEAQRGEKAHNWQGGKSFEPYSKEWTKKLRNEIRKRDGYRCQNCFRHQSELKKQLQVHHIDFNKKNNNPENLISLCLSCHGQTSFNRDDWTDYYQEQMINKIGGK